MTIGGKHKHNYNANPAPGQYEPEGALSHTKPRSKAALIKEETGYQVPRENPPDPGQYDGHIKPFGESPQRMTIGGKYKQTYDANPAPGQYDHDSHVAHTKARSQAALIKEETGYQVPRELGPEPG